MAYGHLRFTFRRDGIPSEEQGSGGVPAGTDPGTIGWPRPTGSKITCIDTGDVYVYDGAAWVQQLNADSTFQDAADALDSQVEVIVAPDAQSDVFVHAAYATGANVNFPGAFGDLTTDVPRNIKVVYDALYDGGDTTIDGTDVGDNVIQEVIADNPGATVEGTKIFKTVTAATQELLGLGGVSASIGTGVKLGLSQQPVAGTGSLSRAGIEEAGTWDATAESWGVTPTNLPDGLTDYEASYQVPGSTSVVTATP